MDNISGRFLKYRADILAISVTQICNLSIKLFHFPNNCKLAKVIPLYQKDSKTDPKKFRPISLLPIVSKIIEKIMYDQTMEYLTDNLLENYLSGRFQRLLLNGQTSSWRPFLVGVPQGSILGLLLFHIYINDLPNELKSNAKLFADNTSLFTIAKDKNESANTLNDDLSLI